MKKKILLSLSVVGAVGLGLYFNSNSVSAAEGEATTFNVSNNSMSSFNKGIFETQLWAARWLNHKAGMSDGIPSAGYGWGGGASEIKFTPSPFPGGSGGPRSWRK